MNAVICPWLETLPPVCECLRPYQRVLIADVAAVIAQNGQRLLVTAPTGCGKSHVIAGITAAARAAGLRVLILATRTRLVWQLHERLEAFQIPHGVIAAALPALNHRASTIQVASVDTLYRRCIVDEKLPLPDADVVIFDEAHLALGESRVALLEKYPDSIHLGFTATPAKVSGRPLRDRFDRLIAGPSIKDLIATGQLVKSRIFAAPALSAEALVDVEKDTKTGDYAVNVLSGVMSQPKLVGDVITNWLRIAHGKRTLVFACTKSHGAALMQEFLQAGIAAELLHDQTPEPEREAAIYRLETCTTTVIVNCFLLSYGVDIPAVECVVLARPTRSVTLYLQAVGRGMRPAPGKDHVIVIDHGRVVESLGMPHADFGWTLTEGNVNNKAREAAGGRWNHEQQHRTCPECSHFWLVSEEGQSCVCCGWTPVPKPKPVAVIEAQLREVNARNDAAKDGEIELFYREALGFYAQRWPDRWQQREKSARWWAWQQTRQRFKLTAERPPQRCWWIDATPAGVATTGYLRSRLIAWAKSKRTA